MFIICAIAYIVSAAVFYFVLSSRAKEIPFPNWVWDEKQSAEVIELYANKEKAA